MIQKFKTMFCARGDQQLEEVDFFDTYAPVVQWTNVQMMLIFWAFSQAKIKARRCNRGLLHADVGKGDNLYVEMPLGFKKY